MVRALLPRGILTLEFMMAACSSMTTPSSCSSCFCPSVGGLGGVPPLHTQMRSLRSYNRGICRVSGSDRMFPSRSWGNRTGKNSIMCENSGGSGGEHEEGIRDRQTMYRRQETDIAIVKRVFHEIKTKDKGRIEVDKINTAIDEWFWTMEWADEEREEVKKSFNSLDGTLTFSEFCQALEDVCGEFELSAHELAVVFEEIVLSESGQNGAVVFEKLLLSHNSPNYRWTPEAS